jgi:hypothetical protein
MNISPSERTPNLTASHPTTHHQNKTRFFFLQNRSKSRKAGESKSKQQRKQERQQK